MKRVDENPPERFPDRPLDQAEGRWWIVKVKPRMEKAIAWDFYRDGIEYYLPLYTKVVRRNDNNKPRKTILPLFPGYVSYCVPRGLEREIFKTGRVVNIVEVKYQKRFIEELGQINRSLISGVNIGPLAEAFEVGDEVEIVSGPLRGIRGMVSSRRDPVRLVLSVQGLGRAAMSIDASWLKKTESAEPDE